MSWKYLHVKKSRALVIKPRQKEVKKPGRRSFLKQLGIGAIIWSPVADSVAAAAKHPFQVKKKKGQIIFYRNGKPAWEISERFFAQGYSLDINQQASMLQIKAKGLCYPSLQSAFSLNATISLKNSEWRLKLDIPEFNMHDEVDFIDWLEGCIQVLSTMVLNRQVATYYHNGSVSVSGLVKLSLNNQWHLSYSGHKAINIGNNGKSYFTNEMLVAPQPVEDISYLKNTRHKASYLLFNDFEPWHHFLKSHMVIKNRIQQQGCSNLNLQMMLNNDVAFWMKDDEGNLAWYSEVEEHSYSLDQSFFYTEYSQNKEPRIYLSASIGGGWLPGLLSDFKLGPSGNIPDYEYIGTLTDVSQERFEPQLTAFQPTIPGAVGLATVVDNQPNIQIIPQEPIKKATKKVQIKNSPQVPVKKNVRKPELQIAKEKIKFKPRQAIKVKIIRPEDLIWLEFEFYNFDFVKKGMVSYVVPSSNRKKGWVIIHFSTQHTLEEAFYLSNKASDNQVDLPAKHIRAKKSRLVYELPKGHKGFSLTMEELLDWSKFNLRVNKRAWIKLPQVRLKTDTRFVDKDLKLTKSTTSDKYLKSDSKDYGIKLYANSRKKTQKEALYNEGQLNQVISSKISPTIKANFNLATIKNINLKVGPVPATETSIEAPALMFISPNQVNDFIHQQKLQLRDHTEETDISGINVSGTNKRITGGLSLAMDNLSTRNGKIAELWHTMLGVRLKGGKATRELGHLKTIRALWAFEANENYQVMPPLGEPFMASLDGNDRHVLVHTTSNYAIPGYSPKPVKIKNLMLTTLGAYLDWHAFFDVPTPADNYLNIIEWEHLATLGRDHYVKVVREGYLWPFSHRATLVKVTERKFDNLTKSAVNRQHMYIVVLQKEVLYSRNDINNQFIPFAFQAVRIETTRTPKIDNPLKEPIINVPPSAGKKFVIKRFGDDSGGNTAYNFYIKVNGKGFKFDLILTDKEGEEHLLRMPLVFIENRIGRDASLVQQLINQYNPNATYTKMPLGEQSIAYTESMVDGDTNFETDSIQFGAQVYPAEGAGDVKFHPIVQEAEVFIKQLDELTGVRKPAKITLEDDNNDGMVFAQVYDAVVDFSNGSDKSGGFVSPNMGITGLSKLQGPVGGKIADSKALTFNPEDFFAALEDFPVAKIFGVIKIFDLLLGDMDLGSAFDEIKSTAANAKKELEDVKNEILFLENKAKETKENLDDQINTLKQTIKDKTNELLDTLNGNIPKIPNFKSYVTSEAFYAEYKWQPQFKSNPIKIIEDVLHVNVDDPNTALTITTKLEKPFDASKEAKLAGSARFEKFGIDLVPLLAVNFNYLEFKTGLGEKTDVKVDIDAEKPIEFKGALSFVNSLQDLIPNTGFSDDGPYINLQPTGITAGFTIGLPNVEVGICMITNISLGASVTLPFTGAPLTMAFNFCKRENPFMLTISCFGGGGYFMLVSTLKGLKSIEAAFEFGAAISLNVGVASGGVSVMGGIYYKFELMLEEVNGETEEIGVSTLEGYLRINGHLSILGIISISMEFYLAFIAVFSEGKVEKLEGVATVKVKVEILFFSKTVSVTVRRELKGADADPKFIEMIDEDDWQEYCLAFAG